MKQILLQTVTLTPKQYSTIWTMIVMCIAFALLYNLIDPKRFIQKRKPTKKKFPDRTAYDHWNDENNWR